MTLKLINEISVKRKTNKYTRRIYLNNKQNEFILHQNQVNEAHVCTSINDKHVLISRLPLLLLNHIVKLSKKNMTP